MSTIIIGAGGMSIETAWLLTRAGWRADSILFGVSPTFLPKKKKDRVVNGIRVISTDEIRSTDEVIIGLGSPAQ